MKIIKILVSTLLLFGILNAEVVKTQPNKETVKKELSPEDRLQQIKKLQLAIQLVEALYVEEKDFDEIINNFIKGGLKNLDPHSTYLDEKGMKGLKETTEGEFGGVGFVVSKKKGLLTIIAPIEDTPAFKAGIKSGDIIAKIDGHNALDISLDEAVKKMRGKPDTKVTLVILRDGETKPLTFNIVRAVIQVKSVKYKIYKDTLYIKVTSFDSHVSEDIKKILIQFKDKHIRGIVLDLRNNPGGLLNEAIKTSDLFVKKGKIIVQSKNRTSKGFKKVFSKTDNLITEEVPLVVLVNVGSASASEIVSGCIQDHNRGIIIGEKTFGKGSIQQIFDIGNKEGIKITIGRYYLPSGRTIQNEGITPDLIVLDTPVPTKEKPVLSFKEADYENSLQNNIKKFKKEEKLDKDKVEDKNLITDKDLLKDLQLKSAIDVLTVLIKSSQK